MQESKQNFKKIQIYYNTVERIPKKWEIVEVGKICHPITKGTTPSTEGEKFTKSGIKFFKVEDLDEVGNFDSLNCSFISENTHKKLKRSQLKENDILFSIAGTLGKVGIICENQTPSNTNQALSIIRLKDESIHLPYFFQVLTSPLIKKQIKIETTVSSQPNLSLAQVSNFKIVKPSMEEQKEIAFILSNIDSKIEKIDILIRQTKLIKIGIFQHMLKHGIRNEKLKNSEIGEIPHSWMIKNIGDFSVEIKEKYSSEIKAPVLSVTKHRGFVKSDDYFKKQVYSENLKNYKLVYRGDFAYATIHLDEGSIGHLTEFEYGYISPMYKVFRIDSTINPNFLFTLMKSEQFIKKYSQIGVGSIRRRRSVSFKDLSQLKIPFPEKKEQEEIIEILNQFNKKIQNLIIKKEKNHILKIGIMKKLFSGELRV